MYTVAASSTQNTAISIEVKACVCPPEQRRARRNRGSGVRVAGQQRELRLTPRVCVCVHGLRESDFSAVRVVYGLLTTLAWVIDDFGVRALFCVLVCCVCVCCVLCVYCVGVCIVFVIFIGGVLRGGVLPQTHQQLRAWIAVVPAVSEACTVHGV